MSYTYNDAYEYLKGLLETRFPNLAFADDDALNDLLVKPASYLTYETLAIVENAASHLYLSDLDSDIDPFIIDEAASNFFIYRQYGKRATGEVTIYFTSPENIEIKQGATISTMDGKIYVILNRVALTSTQLSAYENDGYYEVNVPVSSVNVGSDYNLPENTSFVATGGITGPVGKISNKSAISGGADQELSTTFITRILRDLPTVPTSTTIGGLERFFFENYADYISDIAVIGAGDEYMVRDLISNICSDGINFCGKIRGSNLPILGAIYESVQAYPFRSKYDSMYSTNIIYSYSSTSQFSVEESDRDFRTYEIGVGDLGFFWVNDSGTYSFYGPYVVEDYDETSIDFRKIDEDSPPSGAQIERYWVMGRAKEIMPIPNEINENLEISTVDYSKWCMCDDYVQEQSGFLYFWLHNDITDDKLEDTWTIRQLDSTNEPVWGITYIDNEYSLQFNMRTGPFGTASEEFYTKAINDDGTDNTIVNGDTTITIKSSKYPVTYRNIGVKNDLYIFGKFEILYEDDEEPAWAFFLTRHNPEWCSSSRGNLNGLGVALRRLKTSEVQDSTDYVTGNGTITNGKLVDPSADFEASGVVPGIPVLLETDIESGIYYVLDYDATSLYFGSISLSGDATYQIDRSVIYNCANVVITEVSEEGHRYLTPSKDEAKKMLKKYGGVLDSIFDIDLFHTLAYGRFYIEQGMKYNIAIQSTENNAIAVKIWPDNGQVTCNDISKIKWLLISPPYIDPVVDGEYFEIGLWNASKSVWKFTEDFKAWPRSDTRPFAIAKFHIPTSFDISSPVQLSYCGYVNRSGTHTTPSIYVWNNTKERWELYHEEQTSSTNSITLYFSDISNYIVDDYLYIGVTSNTFEFDETYGCQTDFSDGIYHDYIAIKSLVDQYHTYGATDVYLFTSTSNTTTDATIQSDNMIYLDDSFKHPIARINSIREKATMVEVDYNISIDNYVKRFSPAESIKIRITDFPPGTVVVVDYDYFTKINDIQNDISSSISFFPHQDILLYHFEPVYVKIDLTYKNGPSVRSLIPTLREYINSKTSLSIYELKTYLLSLGLTLEDLASMNVVFTEHVKAGGTNIYNDTEFTCNDIQRLVFDESGSTIVFSI